MVAGVLLTNISNVQAAAQVNYLNVDGDTVHFSTAEAKSQTPPQCAVADTNDRFAVSLNTEAGRAMYSLLVTAMASKQGVSVESAQDCADAEGVERAKAVSIVPEVQEVNGKGKALYLYTNDGATKLGRILSHENTSGNNFIYYVDENNNAVIKKYSNTAVQTQHIYYTNYGCTGTGYINYASLTIVDSTGKTYRSSSSTTSMPSRSMRHKSTGDCTTQSGYTSNKYVLNPSNYASCGYGYCQIKEE